MIRVPTYKIYPDYFRAAVYGHKTAEVRPTTHGMNVGDRFVLREVTLSGGYTGKELPCIVTHVCKTPYRDQHGRPLFLISFHAEEDL